MKDRDSGYFKDFLGVKMKGKKVSKKEGEGEKL